jgi:hypothetical protein
MFELRISGVKVLSLAVACLLLSIFFLWQESEDVNRRNLDSERIQYVWKYPGEGRN